MGGELESSNGITARRQAERDQILFFTARGRVGKGDRQTDGPGRRSSEKQLATECWPLRGGCT